MSCKPVYTVFCHILFEYLPIDFCLAMRFEAMQIELFSCIHQYFTLPAVIKKCFIYSYSYVFTLLDVSAVSVYLPEILGKMPVRKVI